MNKRTNICKQLSDKWLISKIYKKLIQLNIKKQSDWKMGRGLKNTFFQRWHTESQQVHEKMFNISNYQFSTVQLLSCVQPFVTPWITARQASLSITNPRSSLRLTSIESVMPSSHLILCRPLLLLPSILHSNRVFSNESALRMRWPKYWSSSFNISPSNEHPPRTDLL